MSNDNIECKHKNLRKVVRLIVNCPIDYDVSSKASIRSKKVQIVGRTRIGHMYCADCGKELHLYTHEILRLFPRNFANKMARLSATKTIADCGLREAKHFVEDVFYDYGRGDIKMKYMHITANDVKNAIKRARS